jgi:hypothetical protein
VLRYSGTGQGVPNCTLLLVGIPPIDVTHSAVTDESGRFTLIQPTQEPIGPPGEYQVAVLPRVQLPDDSEPPENGPWTPPGPDHEQARRAEQLKVVPARYLDPRTSGLTVTLKEDRSYYEIEIEQPR